MGGDYEITQAASIEAKRWEGYGTALKPAWEPIILAQKPFKGTIANNVLTHGVGSLNIDGCRIGAGEEVIGGGGDGKANHGGRFGAETHGERPIVQPHNKGRFPANAIFDEEAGRIFDDSGGASRFFYCPKTPKKERTCMGFVENLHPTVKPLKLMEWLVKLACPTKEAMGRTPVVVDCFVGSGSTAIAAHRLGFDCIGIDADEE